MCIILTNFYSNIVAFYTVNASVWFLGMCSERVHCDFAFMREGGCLKENDTKNRSHS